MDRIADTIGRVKQATYTVCRRLPELRQCAAVLEGMATSDALTTKASQAQDAATKITSLMAAIHTEIEALEAYYVGHDEPKMPDMREIPLRPAPPGSKESAAGFATWPVHGCAGECNAPVSPASRRVSRAVRPGAEPSRLRIAPGSMDREPDDLADAVPAGG